jgi:hypothetical protein
MSNEETRAELLSREWERVVSYRERALIEARNGNLFPRIQESQIHKPSPSDTPRARALMQSMELDELRQMRVAYDQRAVITKRRRWGRRAVQAMRQAEAALAHLNDILDSPNAYPSTQSYRNEIKSFTSITEDVKMGLQRFDVEGRVTIETMFSQWDPVIHARNMFLNDQIAKKQALSSWDYEDKCIAFLVWGATTFKVDHTKIMDLEYRAKIVMMAHANRHEQLCQHNKQYSHEYINQRQDFGIKSQTCLCVVPDES